MDLDELINKRSNRDFRHDSEDIDISPLYRILTQHLSENENKIREPDKFFIRNSDNNSLRDYFSLSGLNSNIIEKSNIKENLESKIIEYNKNFNEFETKNKNYISLNSLENIISPIKETYSNKNIDISERIINFENSKIIESNKGPIESIISRFISGGYIPLKKEGRIFERIEETPKKRETEEPLVGLTTQEQIRVPAEYNPLMMSLAKAHPGIRYTGMVNLRDQSQHNVDILAFEYMQNGQLVQMHVVAKDKDAREEVIPVFLNNLGITTHTFYDRSTRLLLEHVGQYGLRDVVRNASEPELIRACAKALDKISQIHVVATQHLDELEHSYGLVLPVTDYNTQFRMRFLRPVSGSSLIISPQMNRLMQAYASFSESFSPENFIHGDFHTGNCRVSDDRCYIFDYEWAKIGMKFDDLARFTNSVLRDKPSLDSAEFTREVLRDYVTSHNNHSQDSKGPLLMQNEWLATAFRYSLINDELSKIGEYVSFAELHPPVKDEKLEKSRSCFERAVNMIDSEIGYASITGREDECRKLFNLRGALVDFVAKSPVKHLRETTQKYMIYQPVQEQVHLAA